MHSASQGYVYLVGSGPGDPGLLTLRGRDCLARAEVVLYDYLVNPEILRHAAGAELICLGKHGRDRILSQDEVNSRMVEFARAGRIVVRLKGGDPAVFAHSAEEIAALVAAKIPFEVVPGITVALAAASYTGIPITHGELASAVALVAGRERDGKESTNLDFAALAKFPGTLVFYMGVTTARQWSTALIAAGKSSDTPVALVRRCSWPDQETIACTLGTLADVIEQRGLRPPVISIVGPVVSLAETSDWFSRRPLAGLRVLVTRPQDQVDVMRRELAELGAEVLVQPAIEIGPPDDWRPVDDAIAKLASYDWLVFSSSNGVRYFIDRLIKLGHDLRALGGVKLAAIGPGTADALSQYHLRADLVPSEYRAEALALVLAPLAARKRVLLVRASRGREVLATDLRAAGAEAEQIVAYSSRDVTVADSEIQAKLAAGKIDWVFVSSSSIARSLVALFGDVLRHCQLASISPVTSATLRELGFEPHIEASSYTPAGLVDAVKRRLRD